MPGRLETKTQARKRAARERSRDRAAQERRDRAVWRREDSAKTRANLAGWRRHKRRQYKRRRKQSDPGYMVKERLSKRLAAALRGRRKSAATMRLVGCDLDALRVHIESMFLPGMGWWNRHLWHIDHIRPCASFDLTDPDQQAACFHYSNLRPLWAGDNIRKSDSWTPVGGLAEPASTAILVARSVPLCVETPDDRRDCDW